MAHWGTLVTALVGCLLAGGVPGAAQTVGATTGAVNGKVTDGTGGLLPGVTVVTSGGAMMGTRTTVTDARGWYEVPLVPPGRYALEFSLAGFKTVKHPDVHVNLGETATLDIVLDLATGQETVDVSARPAVIDRSGTTMTFSLDAQRLADLPASRGIGAIYAATPGIQLTRFDVGGNAAIETGPYGAYGGSRPEQPTLEGIVIISHTPLGFTLDYGSFEHVAVTLGAFNPESPWPGALIRIVTKSGGSRLSGVLYLDYENRRWQGSNIDDDQIDRGAPSAVGLPAREANRLWGYHDANADAGGPLRKDRLWWYLSLRGQELATRQVRFPVKAARTRVTNLGGKATAQAGNNQFVVFGQETWNRQPNRLLGFLNPMASIHDQEDSTTNQAAQGGVWKVEWNHVRKNVVFEVLGGQFIAGRHERSNSLSSRRTEDMNLKVQGGTRDWETTWRNDQIVGAVFHEMTGVGGSHSLKMGGSLYRFTPMERWNRGYLDDVLHVTRGGSPVEVYLFQTPSKSVSAVQQYAAHLHDSWRVADRFTLNLGLRFDRYRVSFPAQEHPAGRSGDRSWPRQTFAAVHNLIDWNVVAPRLGVSHDLTGDGRTLLKATYGRYWLPPGIELLFGANPNSREWWEKSSWVDANDNDQWDPGEDVSPVATRERRGGAGIESLDPGLKLDFIREVTARLEREIVPNMRLETGVVLRGQRQPFIRQNESQPFSAFTRAVPRTDPGIDGLPGTPDDGPPMVIYDLPESPPLPFYTVRNVPNARSDWLTWEVTAVRRLHRRWSLVAGFSHTWAREHANTYFGQAVRANVYPLTPNDLINTGEDGRHEFRVWSARAYGTYEGPWGLRITPFLRHQSGQPYGRTFVVSNVNLGTSLRVLAEPIGTRRMDHVTLFDARVEKKFSLGPGRRIAAFADVFNLLNTNPEQNLNWSSTPAGVFQSPIAIVPPRIARIGVRLGW